MRDRTITRTILTLAAFVLLTAAAAQGAGTERFEFTKLPELQQVRPKKPVRIKLRRTARDEYIWELSGDDVDEVVKADRRLRKMLNIK
jgi:hypothetical protein